MTLNAGWYAGELRRELAERARGWAAGRRHVESFGASPVIVFEAQETEHGNFFVDAYIEILKRPGWMRRFDKIHAQGRALPKAESGRRWRELDSSMSSDALLMNVFCGPRRPAMWQVLGVEGDGEPEFGWKARVPLASGRFDRTEVDMRWGGLLVEAKLTETDFQTRSAKVVEGYRDFDAVFERELLPRVEIRESRRRTAVEFAEEFTQEWEGEAEENPIPSGAEARGFEEDSMYGLKPVPSTWKPDSFTQASRVREAVAREFQQGIVARAREVEPAEPGYASYQLIRNVLAAYAEGCSFCVLHDARRPDLREAWFRIMAAVKSAEMRTRCKVMTWQELAGLTADGLREFLAVKYGIVG